MIARTIAFGGRECPTQRRYRLGPYTVHVRLRNTMVVATVTQSITYTRYKVSGIQRSVLLSVLVMLYCCGTTQLCIVAKFPGAGFLPMK